jgi:hypothetical protein
MRDVAATLSRKELSVAHTASMYLHWQQSGGLSHSPAPFSFCGVWATGANKAGPLSGTLTTILKLRTALIKVCGYHSVCFSTSTD